MQSIVLLSSVRRSLFAKEVDRGAYLQQLMNFIREILKNNQGLHHQDNYHQFCRQLGRLKANYQARFLGRGRGYEDGVGLMVVRCGLYFVFRIDDREGEGSAVFLFVFPEACMLRTRSKSSVMITEDMEPDSDWRLESRCVYLIDDAVYVVSNQQVFRNTVDKRVH